MQIASWASEDVEWVLQMEVHKASVTMQTFKTIP